ncbi:uncharacterized protein V1518DRAFT_376100 [Limtongia smithiae]|uniref:uncharacterized protein n=1 Tax=Limtongia smithiae TaxID=1125753 RepID=UPI0034CFAC03
MSSKVFVVTGANRGIGLSLVEHLSKEGEVIATVRDASTVANTPLSAFPNVKIVELEAESEESIAKAAVEIEKLAPTGIDVLWNNIGVYNISKSDSAVEKIKLDVLSREVVINAVSPVAVTVKLLPLLEKRDTRKVVFLSSLVSSVSTMGSMPQFITEYGLSYAYSASKSAQNAIVNFLNVQLQPKKFTIVSIHPGLVATDMMAQAMTQTAEVSGAITPDESATGMIAVVDKLTAEDKYVLRDYAGNEYPF